MIVRMANRKEDIPAGAKNVRDVSDLWRSSTYKENQASFQLWLYDEYVGLCVKDREANFYDDSDFYMTVYHQDTGGFAEVQYATTRGWTYPAMASCVDASPEIMEKFKQYQENCRKEEYESWRLKKAACIEKGKKIIVVKGRKVPVGIKGTCIWRGSMGPTWQYRPDRIGLKTEDGAVYWTSVNNVEILKEN